MKYVLNTITNEVWSTNDISLFNEAMTHQNYKEISENEYNQLYSKQKIQNWLKAGNGAVEVSTIVEDLLQIFLFETNKEHTDLIQLKWKNNQGVFQTQNLTLDTIVNDGLTQELINSVTRAQVEIGTLDKTKAGDYTSNMYLESAVKEWMSKHKQGTMLSAYLPIVKQLLTDAGIHSILSYYKRESDNTLSHHLKALLAKTIIEEV